MVTHAYATVDDLEIEGETERVSFTHVRVTLEAEQLRKDVRKIQGVNRTFYCGSWLEGLTLHEDAVVTGLKAANGILSSMGLNPVVILERAVPLNDQLKDGTLALQRRGEGVGYINPSKGSSIRRVWT